MKKYTIEELEARSGEKLEEALQDYLESCLRTGHYNQSQNVSYFMRENNIVKEDFYKVLETYQKLEGAYND